ncbi:copper chaperone PCu(A)C [Sandarakinorhabdus rubra]|uniref:copper chaperone PCu(A)C n=1 Tax=Sandarakinorhabdus rubra TaxID=2672568 RepID=UPI0013DAF7F9|nr:copper chaperone PCu(A)C [Sandarakinorhabdus rubra]
MRARAAAVLLAILLAPATAAKPVAVQISQPVVRLAHPAAKTGAGFMVITNSGLRADRLLAVETQAATRADLHGTISDGGVMRMRAQAGGVAVPAGGRVAFTPGGLHVMFIGLKGPFPVGSTVSARLRFAGAGTVDVRFRVVPP